MPYQPVFKKLSFQQVKDNDPMIPVGDPVIVTDREFLPDWVPTFQINALLNAGMIKQVSDPGAYRFENDADALRPRTADQPTRLPTENVVSPLVMAGDGTVVAAEQGSADDEAPSSDESSAKPGVRDSKEAWEAYAVNGMPVEQRLTQDEAEGMTKTALIAEVNRREQAATAPNITTSGSSADENTK